MLVVVDVWKKSNGGTGNHAVELLVNVVLVAYRSAPCSKSSIFLKEIKRIPTSIVSNVCLWIIFRHGQNAC